MALAQRKCGADPPPERPRNAKNIEYYQQNRTGLALIVNLSDFGIPKMGGHVLLQYVFRASAQYSNQKRAKYNDTQKICQ
jgi:hypothetical protein